MDARIETGRNTSGAMKGSKPCARDRRAAQPQCYKIPQKAKRRPYSSIFATHVTIVNVTSGISKCAAEKIALRFTFSSIIDGFGLCDVREMARVPDDHRTRGRDVLAQHFTRSLEWTENDKYRKA